MHPGGDILAVQKESEKPFSLDYDIATGDGTVTIVPLIVNFQICVQEVVITILTHANAKNVVVQDSNSVKIASINDLTAAAGVPEYFRFDWGPHGTKMTLDKSLTLVNPSSGPVMRVHVEGYYKPGRTLNLGMTNNTL